MTSITHVQALIASLSLLMMLGTVPIMRREARPRSSVAFGVGFLLIGIAVGMAAQPARIFHVPLTQLLEGCALIAGVSGLWIGTWIRCGARVPYLWLGLILAVWAAAVLLFPLLHDVPVLRYALAGIAIALGSGFAMWAVLIKKPTRNFADVLLAATFAFAGVSELVVMGLAVTQHLGQEQIWLIRAATLPLTLVGIGIFVLQSYALDSIDDLNRRSETDPLTELLNRRAFDDRLARALASARRYRRSLSLVMTDLDHFKRINDSFGHAAGDDVLKAFAELLALESRAVDTVARVGGEEFAIIMPEVSGTEAMGYAERVRVATERRIFVHGQGVTASFGIADTADGCYDAKALFGAADAAMYAAKTSGRNRIFHQAPPTAAATG